MSEIRTRCELAPPLDALPDALRGVVRVADGDLVVGRGLSKEDAKALRLALDLGGWRARVEALAAGAPVDLPLGVAPQALAALGLGLERDARGRWRAAAGGLGPEGARRLAELPERLWNRAIDRVLGQQSLAASFPISLWGAVLDGLKDGDETALRKLCELYRGPLERMLRRRLGATTANDDGRATVEDFLGWLFAEGLHRQVRLTDATGRGFWFRGFLKRWVLAYARRTRPVNGAEPLDGEEPPAPAAPDPFDRDLASALVERALERLRDDSPKAWRATVLYGLGFTWKAIGRDAGEALTTAYERAQRRWSELEAFVRARFLEDLVPGPDEAAAELAALRPELQRALAAYVAGHAVPVLERALRSPDAVAVAAAARSAAALGRGAVELEAALAAALEAPIADAVREPLEAALAALAMVPRDGEGDGDGDGASGASGDDAGEGR